MNEVDNDNKYYSYQLVLDDEDALRAYELLKPTITRQSN